MTGEMDRPSEGTGEHDDPAASPGGAASIRPPRGGAPAFDRAARVMPRAPLPWRPGAGRTALLALLAADASAWLLAAAAVHLLRMWGWGSAGFSLKIGSLFVLWLLFRVTGGLYRPFGVAPPERLRRSIAAAAGAFFVHLLALFALDFYEAWHIVGLAVWPLVVPLTYFARGLARASLIRHRRFGHPYVVIGTGQRAKLAILEMKANPDLGLVPVAAFSDAPELRGRDIAGVPVLGGVEDATRHPFPYPIRHAMLASGDAHLDPERIRRVADRLAKRFPVLQILTDLDGPANLLVKPCPIGPYLALEMGQPRFSKQQRLAKRAFDLVVAGVMLVVVSPVIGAAALLVKLVSPGPAFFAQTREGLDGKPIRVRKIRTMVMGAEKRLAEHLAADPAARFEYERTLKLRDDPRVIPGVGAFLRRTSIDELPQLWSVITGEMSLVGPRVMPRNEVERYSEEGRSLRRDVAPGLTGLWQVTYRNNSDLHVRETADAYYVRNWSVWMDMWILLRTVRVVLAGSGAY